MDAVSEVRRATDSDLYALAHHRVAMFRDMHAVEPASEPALLQAAVQDLSDAIAAGEYVAWLAHLAGQPQVVVAGAGVQLRRLLPRPDDDRTTVVRGREGIVLNMYVEPDYRRRGIARQLMNAILAWARDGRVARLVLHASQDGRHLYTAMGFVPTNEMQFSGPLSHPV
jgi:GNAT superfamily N-acetyltransferase